MSSVQTKISCNYSFITVLLFLILLVLSPEANSQVRITDGSVLTMDINSLLELESTNKGLLIPRVAIGNLTLPSPLTAPVPTGMMIYSLGGAVTDGFYYWNGTSWIKLATGATGQWITNGTSIYYSTGNVGIGVTAPAEPLEVNGNIKIGNTTTGTIRSTNELILRQDGDVYGPSILRLRNRNTENGAIFETTDATYTLVDFIFRNALGQRNIRFESRAAFARTGVPSFHLAGASPDNPTLSLGDNYAAFNKNVSETISILNSTFYNTTSGTDIGISYAPATFTSFTSMFITSNAWNNQGSFMSGFDFSRSDGRDANAFMISNAGIEDERPHSKINVNNNVTTTTVTTAGTFYKANWTNTSIYAAKWTIANNRITYQPVISRDAWAMITGNIAVNNANRVITIAVYKNGIAGTRYGIRIFG